MPVFGLPHLLERALNSLLAEQILVTWKLAGVQTSVIVTMRFQTQADAMAEKQKAKAEQRERRRHHPHPHHHPRHHRHQSQQDTTSQEGEAMFSDRGHPTSTGPTSCQAKLASLNMDSGCARANNSTCKSDSKSESASDCSRTEVKQPYVPTTDYSDSTLSGGDVDPAINPYTKRPSWQASPGATNAPVFITDELGLSGEDFTSSDEDDDEEDFHDIRELCGKKTKLKKNLLL